MSAAAATASASAAATTHKEAGNAKFKAGDFAGALIEYSLAIDAAPNSQLYSNRAAAHLQLKHARACLRDCKEALRLDADNTKAFIRACKALVQLGRLDDAASIIQTGCVRDPRDDAARAEKAAVTKLQRNVKLIDEYAGKDWDRALSLASGLTDSCPLAYDLYMKRLDMLIAARRLDDAYTLSSDMLKGKHVDTSPPDTSPPSAPIASVNSWEGVLDAATESRAVDGEADPRLLTVRARIFNLQGNSAMALKHLTEALRVDPDFAAAAKLLKAVRKAEAFKNAGNDHFKASRWAESIAAYSECLALDPSDENVALASKLYANRAAAFMKINKPAQAYEDCSKCIALDDKYSKAYIRRAQAGVALGDLEHLECAVRDYNRAKELCSDGDRDVLREVERGLKETKALLRKARRKDYYKILEVSRDADDDALKKAYRKAALKWHPDRHSTAEDEDKKKAESIFKDVTEAYTILSDATKRRQYDAGATFTSSGDIDVTDDADEGSPFVRGGMGGMHGMHGGMGGMGGFPPEMFEMFMNGFGGGMGGGMPAGFAAHMGGGGPSARRRAH